MNRLPRIGLVKDADRPEIYLVANGVRLHIESMDDFNALGFDGAKVRIVPRHVIAGLVSQPFALPPSVKPSDRFLGKDEGEGGPKDIRSCVARDILVAGWLTEEQGTPRVNGGIAGNMGDGFGVADIVYGNVHLDIGFLGAMYGRHGLSSNVRAAKLPGNPSAGAAQITVADISIVNSFSLPSDDLIPESLTIHVELNCWHEKSRGGNLGTRQRAVSLGPHPEGWVQQWWHSDFTDCWWPFPPFNPDNGPRDLRRGDYVLIRGAFWQDVGHGLNPVWASIMKGHNGWLEIHPVDYMRRIPPPGLTKTALTESYAGESRERGREITPEADSAIPLQVSGHESVVDTRFTIRATLVEQTATELGDRIVFATSVRRIGAQAVRFKAGHIVTWALPAPAACSVDPAKDRLDVFARGRDDACWYRRLDPSSGGWQPWESLGGVLTADPAVTIIGGVPTVVARGDDGALYWKWYTTAADETDQYEWQRLPDTVPGEASILLTGGLRTIQ
jgi:hypothetical protein